MTIQQMLFNSSDNTLAEYIGFAYATTGSTVNQLRFSSPSAAQVGDLILILGCTSGVSAGVSYSISGVTEVKDSGIGPNLYIGYKTLSTIGEQYTVLLNTSARNISFFSVAYRKSAYSSYSSTRKTTYASQSDPVSVSITPTVSNASIIGLITNREKLGNGTWAFTETAPSTTSLLYTSGDVALFQKEPVSSQLSYTFSSLNFENPTEIGLVSIRGL